MQGPEPRHPSQELPLPLDREFVDTFGPEGHAVLANFWQWNGVFP